LRSTGVWVNPKLWDNKNKVVKAKHPQAQVLNAEIQVKKQEFDRFILAQTLDGSSVDLSILEVKKNCPTLFSWFEKVISTNRYHLSKRTNQAYLLILHYLKEHSKDIKLKDINVEYLENFNNFLLKNKKLSNNSRWSILSKVNKVLNQGIKNDLITYTQNPFNKGFNVKWIEPEKKSLTLKELRIIENFNTFDKCPSVEKTRDMFLFSCYTSVHFSDLISLTSENFMFLNDGRIRISYVPVKNRRHSNKPIEWIITDLWNGKIDFIVKKYLKKTEKKQPFFGCANSSYNRDLKLLQELVGIETPLTSHLGRHSCITLLVNDFAMDITKTQMIAGHSQINMTRGYLRITERDLSEASKKINWNI